ncbi:fungal-specific transcription factor domain-containing protein [Dichotomopilus funicola]|uniref:Fungal-specific transcription factor domain-containing protein n=1 Tax=Dichotomopilus funicola TaxID=1934379 RepID=A0AAN6ZJI2_9PEZI|nr:fungal-specific transcription factor domain-containing protein [Dichotomopilus funicola]
MLAFSDGTRVTTPSRACHNCRRRRLRCDRSLPSCRKCSLAGKECLGYGPLLRWANAPAVRGKLVGRLGAACPSRPIEDVTDSSKQPFLSIPPALLDPSINGLGPKTKQYVHHFATVVCRDLVSFDQPNDNPFRSIIPPAGAFGFLGAIIVATGAMNMAAMLGRYDGLRRPELIDALVAKDRAMSLLRAAVDDLTPASLPMVVAATVFLVNLDLIDSGKGGWQVHIEAATKLMPSLLHNSILASNRSLMRCLDVITADCLTYRVLGAAISGLDLTHWAEEEPAEFLGVLERAAAYTYHCCPPEILQIFLLASKLHSNSKDGEAGADPDRINKALALLQAARSFDVVNWVHNIPGLSAHDDLPARITIGHAHRATACLYIILAIPEAADCPSLTSPSHADVVVQEVLGYLSAVPIDHVHLKGTIWPTFVVGAQTDDPAQRTWCLERLEAVWTRNPWMCPWGYIRTTIRMMQDLWAIRDSRKAAGELGSGGRNWLWELKSMRDKCLIV